MRQTSFDAKRFLKENFGTASRLAAFMRAWKVKPPSEFALQKWLQRGQISAEWLPILIVLLELETGKPVSLAAYVDLSGEGGSA